MAEVPTRERGELLSAYVREIEPDLYGTWWNRKRIVEELRDHLEDAVERLENDGLSRREAEERAVQRFGSPEVVARAFAHSKGVGVATKFTRMAGLAGIVGVLIISTALLVEEFSESFGNGAFAEVALTGVAFLAVGLAGMYLRARGNLGRYGRVGFRLMVGGFFVGMVAGSLWFAPGSYAGLVAMVAGIGLYLVAVWRAEVFPRGAISLLMAAAAAGVAIGVGGIFVDTDTGSVAGAAANLLAAAGFIWIGLHLWSERPVESREQPPIAAA